ncbi:MAG: NirD/YgiW/YdeI family stress tolerance protein [Candidatus Anaerobiospirillum merdipullorum]|uniref:NirD/YgiW/YdeI family stress tolerance protein n=1 Tax=Candidatus Anaerobiospirillum merdipullorum TaxID=2838450 RepID=A0A9E2NS13_9GAMM|nr:NirD/YgiW/YdeI family stress tolerance protein [Candidatus Anaerobiospirillum merdipullorum]
MKKLALTAMAVAFVSATALAAPQGFNQSAVPGGPQGFNNQAPNTVSGVLSDAHDDQVVTLQGRLTNFLGDDRYEFTDAAGDRIEVELDDDKNWSNISKDQLINIVGKVDKDLLSTTIEVKQAAPVQQ